MANATTEFRTGTLFSSVSHVMESPEMWADHLPASFWPDGGGSFQGQPGGHDPEARLEEMGQAGSFEGALAALGVLEEEVERLVPALREKVAG